MGYSGTPGQLRIGFRHMRESLCAGNSPKNACLGQAHFLQNTVAARATVVDLSGQRP
jgi:hypothetical protein